MNRWVPNMPRICKDRVSNIFKNPLICLGDEKTTRTKSDSLYSLRLLLWLMSLNPSIKSENLRIVHFNRRKRVHDLFRRIYSGKRRSNSLNKIENSERLKR